MHHGVMLRRLSVFIDELDRWVCRHAAPKGSNEHACIFKLTCKLCACAVLYLYEIERVNLPFAFFALVSLLTRKNMWCANIQFF